MSEVCSICGGSGLRVVQENGGSLPGSAYAGWSGGLHGCLGGRRIPRRYEHCTLENYETDFRTSHRSLARRF